MNDNSRRAVFLDRDGVLNRAILRDGRPFAPARLSELEILPDASPCLERLRRGGFLLLVVTNQPEVSRGTQSLAEIEEMHRILKAQLPIDDFFVCGHDDADRCTCRKPLPGLLLRAAGQYGVSLPDSYLIGDRWKDVDAGHAAGCRTVWIDHGYQERGPTAPPSARTASLQQAVDYVLADATDHAAIPTVAGLKVKLFADGADKQAMLDAYANPHIKGFTTNPTLMRRAGVADYETFARDVLEVIRDRPISFEVFADDFQEMNRQARKIATWGGNVYVKIPVTNTKGERASNLIADLTQSGIKVNVTALLTLDQVRYVAAALENGAPSYVSVFAGRIADTGRDPIPLMTSALEILRSTPQAELIWASPREVLNVFQADTIGCHIITATNDILKKLALAGRDLDTYSRETVQMFHSDAVSSGYRL